MRKVSVLPGDGCLGMKFSISNEVSTCCVLLRAVSYETAPFTSVSRYHQHGGVGGIVPNSL